MKQITPFPAWLLFVLVAGGSLYFLYSLVLVADPLLKAVFCLIAVIVVTGSIVDLVRIAKMKEVARHRSDDERR